MEEKNIVAIDLGSSKIALTVANVNGNDVQVTYYKERA
jgi:cell division ATPase FtsA